MSTIDFTKTPKENDIINDLHKGFADKFYYENRDSDFIKYKMLDFEY